MSEEIKKTIQQISEEDGAWSAHNIHITDDIYTIKDGILNDEYKLRRVIQNISDLTHKEFSELRVLDLACLEGAFGIECAMQGANVMFLDARQSNLRKVEYVTKCLNLDKIEIVKDDVRSISSDKYGMFNVIMCFGIFYHLDQNDLYPFIEKMYSMATDIVMFDTQITYSKKDKFTIDDTEFYGDSYLEHRLDATEEEKEIDLWKSYDNNRSFMLTKPSLIRMLAKAGFTSVTESIMPIDRTKSQFRVSIIAHKGKKVNILTSPLVNSLPEEDIPESLFDKLMKNNVVKYYNNVIYNLKLRSPRIVREIYKTYINPSKDHKNL